MSVRSWLYNEMVQGVTLVEQRVFAKKTMTSAIEETPYIVYKLGYSATEDLAEDQKVNRQFVQVFVHDFSDGQTGDYQRIDAVIQQLKDTFFLARSEADGIISCQWIETSQDLNDETLNTVFKYARFQLITKEQ